MSRNQESGNGFGCKVGEISKCPGMMRNVDGFYKMINKTPAHRWRKHAQSSASVEAICNNKGAYIYADFGRCRFGANVW